MKQLISLEELLKKSWGAFLTEWRNAVKFLLPAIAIPIIGMLPFGLAVEQEKYIGLMLLFMFATILIATYFGLAFTKYFVNVVFKKNESPWPSVGEYFGTLAVSILYGIVVMIGFMLFIVPGIWLAIIYSFSVPVFLNEKLGVFESMKRSSELVKNRWWPAFARVVVPNIVWQMGVSFVVYGSFILFAAFGAIWFGVTAAVEATAGPELLSALGFFGTMMGIAAVIGMIVLQMAAYLAAGIAQLSITLETYKSLEETHKK